MDHLLRAWLLMACTRQERRLGDLARELSFPLPKLHYHVAKLIDCGLLRVHRMEARRGRPIKYYKAIAEAFLVNAADVSEQVSDVLSRELRQSMARQVNRRDSYLRYHLDELGRFRVNQVEPEGGDLKVRVLDYWKIMRLRPERRDALAAELTALIGRYEDASSSDDGELFLVHAAVAPKLRGA
jgi:DNA-binding MarR family transcriptional regulator